MKLNARELFFKQKRFDLIFKYIYLKYPHNDFAKKAYLENIRAFNNFYEVEPSDGIAKNTSEDFINCFEKLYRSISTNGFNEDIGTLPIGNNGEISDGAHRLAVCAFLNCELEVVPDGRNDLYDYKFFQARKMDQDIMDYGALEYVKLNPNAYIINLHSVADMSKDEEVIKILQKYGFIYYKKDISLSFNGYVNLKKLSYGSFWERESWIGTVENKFAGARDHARKSMGNDPLRVFVFVCDDINKVIKLKAEIRALYDIGNYSVHINDTKEEAIWLAETYFNKNSLEMLNRRPFDYEDVQFDEMVEDLKATAEKNQIDIEDICAAGSTPFGVFGLRKSNDLDFLYCGHTPFDIQTETLSNHDSELSYYPYSKSIIIQNPQHHFYYHGLKFITLDICYDMKNKRHEVPKDIKDCKMIRKFQRKGLRRHFAHFKFFEKRKHGLKRTIILFGFIKLSYQKRRQS